MRGVVLVAALLLSAPALALAQDPRGMAAKPLTKPLSLVEALELAERESESVGIAQSDLARAEGERRRARSSYFPQLTASASYTRTLRSQFSALQDDDAVAPDARSPAHAHSPEDR